MTRPRAGYYARSLTANGGRVKWCPRPKKCGLAEAGESRHGHIANGALHCLVIPRPSEKPLVLLRQVQPHVPQRPCGALRGLQIELQPKWVRQKLPKRTPTRVAKIRVSVWRLATAQCLAGQLLLRAGWQEMASWALVQGRIPAHIQWKRQLLVLGWGGAAQLAPKVVW